MTFLHQIDPILFQSPEFSLFGANFQPAVHWYGLMYLLGFSAAWLLGRSRVRAGRLPGVTEQAYSDLLFYCMLGVIFGARIGYILIYDLGSYIADPVQIFKIWQGGMSFHGGMLGVLVAMVWYARSRQRPWLQVMDFVAPCVPTGLAAGRVGNFINGELWGRVADLSLPWGMVFRGAGDLPRHPSQVYQFLMEGVLLFVLLWLYARKPRATGRVSAAFLFGYGVFRFIAEFFREPDAHLGLLSLGMSMGQWLCVPMILGGAALWWWCGRRS